MYSPNPERTLSCNTTWARLCSLKAYRERTCGIVGSKPSLAANPPGCVIIASKQQEQGQATRNKKISPGGSTTHGAEPFSEQSSSLAMMVPVQQSAPVRPATFPQVEPPQTPQAESQQTVASSLSIPGKPLLQTESATATVCRKGATGRETN